MAVNEGTGLFMLVKRTQGVLLVVLCGFLLGTAFANPQFCENAKQHFLSKGYSISEVLSRPANGKTAIFDYIFALKFSVRTFILLRNFKLSRRTTNFYFNRRFEFLLSANNFF